MKSGKMVVRLAAGLWAASAMIPSAFGGISIDVSTDSSAGWTVTGGGATNATPDILNGTDLSLTSTGDVAGTPIAGFNSTTFTGFWTANLSFNVPAGATDVTFDYTNLSADDRAVLFLNGNQIASVGTNAPGSGSMVLTDGGPSTPVTFAGNTSGTITTGLNVGGVNTLSAIINNTTGGIAGDDVPLAATNASDFGLSGTVTYTPAASTGIGAAAVPVPPAVWTGLTTLLGLTTFSLVRRRRRAIG